MDATAEPADGLSLAACVNDVLHLPRKYGLITSMRFLSRNLLAVVLCLVLPLQASAALVRAVTMMAPGHPAQSHAGSASPQVSLQVAHAIGAAHQHGAHAHHEKLPKQKAGKAAPASHKAKHAKGECPSCAKCCLLAAVAPPPAWAPESSIAVSRVAFVAAPLSIPSFLPDGPERPPRLSLIA